MKFTLNWLKEFVTFRAAPEKLAELLTMAGLEVESLTAVREPEGEQTDWLFEIAVTPNRGDCLGIAGLAREVSALTGGRLKLPPVSAHGKSSDVAKRMSVTIGAPRLCARYSARVVDEVRVGPAPGWMRHRLESCGIRSINNVVDVTNYVMLETGQPLHAFDIDRLPQRQIKVRPANEIKKFTTLDGVERELLPEDLLICDGDTAVALAGVMGGMNSEVGDDTHSVLLESANFDPTTIRRTAKRLGLHSEASHRFERGVDPEGTLAALDRAVYLLARCAQGEVVSGSVDRYARRPKPETILLREERIASLLGVRIDGKEVERLLQALGLDTRRQARQGIIKVVSSSRRPDLTREADLVEEVARLYGYQKIPSTIPSLRPSGARKDERLADEHRVRCFLAGEGLVEVINLPFTTEELNRLFPGLWGGSAAPVAVQNPLAKESAEMRLSLLPGLIENLRANLAQQAESFSAYHLGKVFAFGAGAETEERYGLAGLLYGPRLRRGLRHADMSPASFLDAKGLAEGVLDLLRVRDDVTWREESIQFLHPGRAAALYGAERRLGYLGEIHPEVCEQLRLPRFLVFELDFEELLQYAPRRITARPLPRFPAVERDLAVVVDRAFPSQQIISWVENLGESLIKHIEVFDQYLGSPIPEGKKSLAYKISYRADDRTLTDTEVQALHQTIVQRIGNVFGAELRS
jgi:phenylalanyl-tRNA synthetase beta chain